MYTYISLNIVNIIVVIVIVIIIIIIISRTSTTREIIGKTRRADEAVLVDEATTG